MTTFLFNEIDGTSLSQIDPNFQGQSANLITSDGTISVNARNTSFSTWLAGTYGDITYSCMQFDALTNPDAIVCWPSVQKNETTRGYTLSVQNDGRVYVDKNGSWGGYFDNIRGSFDPTTTGFILLVEYNQSTGELVGYVNGVEAGRSVDGAPLTGGYPGFETGGAGGPTQAGDKGVNSAWSNDTTIAFPAPNTPSNLVATEINPYTIGLTWTDNSNDEVAFVVEQESPEASGNWMAVATTAANATAYTVTGLSGSTSYRFRLKADGYGPSSPYVVSNGITTAPPIPAPAAPAEVSIDNVGEQSVDVTWIDTSTNEDDYLIQVETPSGSNNWINATTTTQNPLPAGATSATVTALAGETNYKVRVVARNLGGTASTESIQFTTLVVTLPNAPTNVVETLVTDRSVMVYWDDNSTNETGFIVQFETPIGEGNWTSATGAANPTAKNVTSFLAIALEQSTGYRFRVASTNSAGTSTFAVGAGVTTKASLPAHTWVFDQPDGTQLQQIDSRFAVSDNTIVTNQGALSQNVRNTVNRAVMTAAQGTVQKSIARVAVGSVATWVDPFVCGSTASSGYLLGFDSGMPTFFKNGSFVSRGSTAVDTTTAPYDFSIEFDSATRTLTGLYNGTVVHTWVDADPIVGGAPGFSIGSISTDPPTTNPGPLISWSDGVTAVLSAPDAPVRVRVDTVGSTGATVRWTKGDASTSTFTIERTVVGSGVWATSPGLNNPAGPTDTFHIASSLLSDTTYKFRVRANNSAGNSAWVESEEFTTESLGLVTLMLTMYPF